MERGGLDTLRPQDPIFLPNGRWRGRCKCRVRHVRAIRAAGSPTDDHDAAVPAIHIASAGRHLAPQLRRHQSGGPVGDPHPSDWCVRHHAQGSRAVKLAVAHDVALVMPAACRLGVPISVTAASYDVRLQETSRSLTLPALVDHRSPVLSANVSTPYSAWAQAASFLGYLFTGDAIEVNVTATDNHALHRIYWEVRPVGLRDSLLVSGPDAFRTITIPSRASWTGPIRLVLYAKDESGNVSDTIATAAGAIEVAPNVGPTPTLASIPGDITDVAFDAKRNVIYLLQSNSYKIAVFSPATLTVVRTIALPDNAPAFDLSPSGDSIITVLMNSKAIGVVDLTQASPALTTVPLTDLASTYRLLNVRVASTGRVLFVAQHTAVDSASKRLYSYDLAGGVLRLRLDTP